MESTLQIASVLIEEEHELLDGAGTVRRLKVQLNGGRTGTIVVGEAPAPKNRRRLWAQLIHKGSEGAPLPRTNLESALFAAADEAPAGKCGRRPMKRARRLAALNQLLAQAPALFSDEFERQARDTWGADITSLTWDDRTERARRDRLARRWTIHEAAETLYGGVVARASCRWPDPPLDSRAYADRHRHYVLSIGGSAIKSASFDYANEVPHGLDAKQVKKLRAAVMDGSINLLPPAGVPELGPLLVDIRGGFLYRDEAQAAFRALMEPNPERQVRHRGERDLGPDPVECALQTVEIVERRPIRRESYSSALQGGEALLLRVEPARAPRSSRGDALPEVIWIAAHVGKGHGIPAVRDLAQPDVATALISDDFRAHLPRLVAAKMQGWFDRDATETSARKAYAKVVADDDQRRFRAEELDREVELLAVATIEDGNTLIRYRTRWPTPDPVLGTCARPTEHLALVMTDGVDTYGIGPDDRQQAHNARSNDPVNVIEALGLLSAAPEAYGPDIDDYRWKLAWVLKSLSTGFAEAAAADAAWQTLTSKDVGACAVDPAWGDLSRRRRTNPNETSEERHP